MNTGTTPTLDPRATSGSPPAGRPDADTPRRSGLPLLEVCTASACRAVGGAALGFLEGAGGTCRVEPSDCLGLCAHAPAVVLQGLPYARMSAQRLEMLLQDVGALR